MKQALARALYSRCSILLLDDCLSALDKKTRRTVIERLLGSKGHCKTHGITTILATHVTSVVQYADTVLELTPAGAECYYGRAVDWHRFSDSLSLIEDGEETDQKDDLPEQQTDVTEFSKDQTSIEGEDEELAVMRQSGDITIWTYYFGKIGLFRLLIAAFFIILAVLATSFPSKYIELTCGA
jgi:ABC-type sulfate/molybdate transport systems ATPase subunit